MIIWTMRLQHFDETGAALPPVLLELRGKTFEGAVNDGDAVEVSGQAHPDRALRVRTIKNLSAGVFFGPSDEISATLAAAKRKAGKDSSGASRLSSDQQRWMIALGLIACLFGPVFLLAGIIELGIGLLALGGFFMLAQFDLAVDDIVPP
jgi:hypothetical protein